MVKQTKVVKNFDGRLEADVFASSVDGQENSWRSVVEQEGDAVSIALRIGEWERPDPAEVSQVWTSYDLDFNLVQLDNKSLNFSYTFGKSTSSTRLIFKFGATKSSRLSAKGDYALELVYGGTECTFTVDDYRTSGDLPFEVTEGTTVNIIIKNKSAVDVFIDDIPILADQAFDAKENFVTLFAQNEKTSTPQLIRLSKLEAETKRKTD